MEKKITTNLQLQRHRILRSIFGKMTIHKVARFEKNGRKKREIVKTITFLSL